MVLDLQELTAAKERRAKERGADFQSLAERLHGGEELSADQIIDALERCDHSEEQLCAELKRLKERDTLWAKVKALPDLEAQRDALQARFDESAAKVQAAQERHRALRDDVGPKITAVENRISDAVEARLKLRTARFADQALIARRTELEAERGLACADWLELQKHWHGDYRIRELEQNERVELEAKLRDARARREAHRVSEIEAAIAALPEKTASRLARFHGAKKRLDDLDAAIRDIDAAMA